MGFATPKTQVIRGPNNSRVTFDGKEVRAVRNLDHVDESTLRAMAKEGFAARDINGRKLHLHQLNQDPYGPIVEIPVHRHSVHNRIQHPLGNVAGSGLTPSQREVFDKWRVQYWKARALEELQIRGIQP